MKHQIKRWSMTCAQVVSVCLFLAGQDTQAAVSGEEARQLGERLTPWGAEKAGNADGTIPAYTGEPIKIPAGFDAATMPRKDPFAADKPKFSINAANMDRHADRLSEGVKAMLKKYPSLRLDVYPTRRSVTYPRSVIDNTLKNATNCKLSSNGLMLEGCYGGIPFPIPKTGIEVMWNKLIAYKAPSWGNDRFRSWFVGASGSPIMQSETSGIQESPFYDPNRSKPNMADDVFWRLRMDYSGPSRRVGEKLLIEDSVSSSRRAWQYLPGQRRVKLSPNLAYDTPNPSSGGSAIMDESQVFMGAPDRYDFKLVGKREMYILYNNFKYANTKTCPDDLRLTRNHPNPDCMRWELHRVWVVEAKLKPEFRHIYATRTFYFDEDTLGAGMSDAFDSLGAIHRVALGVYYPMYESQALSSDQFFVLDLRSGAYTTAGDPADGSNWRVMPSKGNRFYSPEAVAGDGIR